MANDFSTIKSHIDGGLEDFKKAVRKLKSKGKNKLIETKLVLDHSDLVLQKVIDKFS